MTTTNTEPTSRHLSNTKLYLGSDTDLADGTYYGVARWDSAHRDYRDVPGVYHSESDARSLGGAAAVGSRIVRWTVYRGSVTTRRGLR
jgi:hypothetical protein